MMLIRCQGRHLALCILCFPIACSLSDNESSWKQLYYESSSSSPSFEEEELFLICTNNEEEVSILKSMEEAVVSDDDFSAKSQRSPNEPTRRIVAKTRQKQKPSVPPNGKQEEEHQIPRQGRLTFVQALDSIHLTVLQKTPSELQFLLLPSNAFDSSKPTLRTQTLRIPRTNLLFNARPIVSIESTPALERILLSQRTISANKIANKKKKQVKSSVKSHALKPAKESPRKESPRKETSTLWIRQFLEHHPSHGLFAVPREFLVDNFNLANLPALLDISSEEFRNAWKTLLQEPYHESDETVRHLFFLMHQRFILSPRGLHQSSRSLCFGRCPSPECHGSRTVPIGHSNISGEGVAREYCANCRQQWINWNWQDDPIVDGCAWGTTFAHLLWLVYGLPKATETDRRSSMEPYVPRIYGFKLHWSAGPS